MQGLLRRLASHGVIRARLHLIAIRHRVHIPRRLGLILPLRAHIPRRLAAIVLPRRLARSFIIIRLVVGLARHS